MGIHAGSNRRRKFCDGRPRKRRLHQNLVKKSSGLLTRFFRRLLENSRRRTSYILPRWLFQFSPFKLLENGTFVLANLPRRSIFYGLSVFYAAIFYYRVHNVIGYLSSNGLVGVGMLSCTYCVSMLGCAAMCYGILGACEDMRQLLNYSHPQCMRQIQGLEDGKFRSLSFLLKRVAGMLLGLTATINPTFFGWMFDLQPVSVYPAVKGILPNWEVPTILWQAALYPLELLSMVPPSLPALVSGYTLIAGLELLKEYVGNLRNMDTLNRDHWREVEQKYKSMLVYNQIFNQWFRKISFPVVVVSMVGMISTLYVTLVAFERLPFLLYFIFPVGTVTALGFFTLFCLEAVGAKMAADDVLQSLRARTGFYVELSRDEKIEYRQRGRALRGVMLPIGDFGDISVDLPVYVIEEVLNQILFLLSF